MRKTGLPRTRERFEAVLYAALQNAAPGDEYEQISKIYTRYQKERTYGWVRPDAFALLKRIADKRIWIGATDV